MIYLIESYGNHSNRLMQHIHLEVFAKENGLKFYNPTLATMIKPYKMSKNFNFTKAYFYNFIFKTINSIYKIAKKVKLSHLFGIIDFENSYDYETNSKLLKKKRNIFVKGWNFRDFKNVLKYKEYFREQFTPLTPLKQELVKIMESDKIKIGVHIRRGDYREWQNGKYYYSDSEYIDIIKKTILLVDKPVTLLFFSNEKIDKELYKSEFGDEIYFSDNPYYIDHIVMADCDYLIGPPSSFTDFASYIGRSKFYHIHDIKKSFTIDDFKHSIG